MTARSIGFIKAHGAGNDFIVLDEAQDAIPVDLEALAPRLCCRRTGIGADGILVIRRRTLPHMECWNSDGSRAESCANGLRVIGLVLDGDEDLPIGTDAGVVQLQRQRFDIDSFRAEAALGIAEIETSGSLSGHSPETKVTAVRIGNPHLVVEIDPDGDPDPVYTFGPALEVSVPGRVNVGFVRVEDRRRLTLRVWERGCGETQACGTGAAAATAALHRSGVIDAEVEVSMPGGILQVRIDGAGAVHVKGAATICYRGQIDLQQFDHRQHHGGAVLDADR